MVTRIAADDVRAAARKAETPETPQAYKLELPKDAPLPAGTEYKFDEVNNKATFDAVRAWAHKEGMSQSKFSEMMSLYASHEANQNAVLAARSQQEIAKAGPNAPQRVDNVGKWLTGMVGEADAAPIKATIVTDAHLRFFEKIITQITNQGGASFSAAHRVPDDNKSIPNYAGMSFEQRRFAQDQRASQRKN